MASLSENFESRRFVLLVCFLVGATLTFQAIRIWVADHRVHSDQIDQMERGAVLEPENAAAWDRLGRARETNLENLDPVGAVADFRKAVALVPLSPTYCGGSWENPAASRQDTRRCVMAPNGENTHPYVPKHHPEEVLEKLSTKRGSYAAHEGTHTTPTSF